MNPSKQEVHLDSIAQPIEGSASIVDIKVPKGPQTTCGWPSCVSKKKTLKTDPCEPSQFERIQQKRVASEKMNQKSKKKKVQPTQKVLPVQ